MRGVRTALMVDMIHRDPRDVALGKALYSHVCSLRPADRRPGTGDLRDAGQPRWESFTRNPELRGRLRS